MIQLGTRIVDLHLLRRRQSHHAQAEASPLPPTITIHGQTS